MVFGIKNTLIVKIDVFYYNCPELLTSKNY